MAIDFPDSPTNGDQFTVGSVTWQWNGVAWVLLRPQSAGNFYFQPTPPNSPAVGARWVDSGSGNQYTYINDGDSSAWIDTSQTASATLPSSATFEQADITMLSANAYYDGPSVLLAPGTYFVSGTALVRSPVNTAHQTTVKLYDGSSIVYAASQQSSPAQGAGVAGYTTINLETVIYLSVETNVYLAAASSVSGATLLSTPDHNASNTTHKATTLTTLKVG